MTELANDATPAPADEHGVVLTVDNLVVEFKSGRQTVHAVSGVSFAVRTARRSGWSANPAVASRRPGGTGPGPTTDLGTVTYRART